MNLDVSPALVLKAAIAILVGFWGGLDALVQALVLLMIIDSISGFIAGYITKTLSSDISFRGMAKKSFILMIVAAGWLLEHKAGFTIPKLDVEQALAGFFCANEGLSILENAARADIGLPPWFKDTLVKIRGKEIVS